MKKEAQTKNILIIGMGAFAFGCERRAALMFKYMPQINPYFLISKFGDGSVERLLERSGFRYERVPLGYLGRRRPIWTLVTLSQLPQLYYKVFSTSLRKRCETIVILNLHSLINAFFSILLLKLLKKRKIVLYLGDIPTNNAIYRIFARIINRLADKIIVNSNAVKTGLMLIGVKKENIRIIYNGINPDEFTNVKPKELHQMFSWPQESILVGYIGQFLKNKGIQDFVRAAELVLGKNKNCRFLLVGKPDRQNPCQQEIWRYIIDHKLGSYIVFAGWIEEIASLYRGLNIVVIPSRHQDPAPNVNIEAMAAGIPVVATRTGGIPELTVDQETGLLVEKENPQRLAECILKLAGDQSLGATMGEAGKRRVRQMFDVRKNAVQLERVLCNE